MKKIKVILVTLVCVVGSFVATAQQPANVQVAEFEKAIANKNIQLLDVRTRGEYKSGHLANALQADWTNQAEFKERVQALDKTKPVYTYCLSGARSNAAALYLIENGFTAVNLAGGIAAWKRAGKAVEGSDDVKQMSLAEYQSLTKSNKTVLVDIGASWCPPCKKMNPVIDSIASVHGKNFQLVKIDGGDQAELGKQLKVASFPTFIIYKNGQETWRGNGIIEARELVKNLQLKQ